MSVSFRDYILPDKEYTVYLEGNTAIPNGVYWILGKYLLGNEELSLNNIKILEDKTKQKKQNRSYYQKFNKKGWIK